MSEIVLHCFILIFTLSASAAVTVTVPSCCQNGQILDTDTMACVGGDSGPIDLSDLSELSDTQITLDMVNSVIPTCPGNNGHLETFSMRKQQTAKLLADGTLMTSKYGDSKVKDFCVSGAVSGDVVAVLCDPCASGQAKCINLCCPHGEVFLQNPNWDYTDYTSQPFVCTTAERMEDAKVNFTTQIRDSESDAMLQWEESKHYVLVGHTPSFDCGPEYNGHAVFDHGKFHVMSNGSLRGSELYVDDPESNATETRFYKPEEYCLVIGALPDYSDYSYDGESTDLDYLDYSNPAPLRQTFMYCLEHEKLSWEESFNAIFHPTALSISTVFLILTLIVYIIDENLRESLMGKLTIGFIVNLICVFICLTDNFIKDSDPRNDRRETIGCILSGYFILYFFNSYFLWINSMAIHIWMSFTNVISVKASDSKKFLIALTYSQGLPILLCILTAIIDYAPTQKTKAENPYYPEIGVYSCYLGSRYKLVPGTSYFQTPIFIYQQSILLLTIVINVSLMAHVCWSFFKARESYTFSGSIALETQRHLATFVKISFVLGFTWISELVSTALHVEHEGNTFLVRTFLDIVNLFLGVLLFLFLVCNRQVLNRLKARILGRDYAPDDVKMNELDETVMN